MMTKKKEIVFLLLLFAFFFTSCESIDAYLSGNKTTENNQEVAFYISTGTTIDSLIHQLQQKNIIEDTAGFRAIIHHKEWSDEKIGAGKYLIQPNTKYKHLINGFTKNRLGNGNQEVEVNVTFNNCRDVYEVAGKIAHQIELDSTLFVNYVFSDSILQKYGFTKERMSALFLPNTYRFWWDTNHEDFVERMAKEFKRFWTPERMNRVQAVGLKNQSDAVTLASIVYEEQSKHASEWKVIAGLYLNRLKKGMRLESDPTFRFCWGEELRSTGRLTFKHRAIDCPYNTYKYAGLPPGPISIPPSEVIDAVLYPDDNDYIFMCAKPEFSGLHNFARTYAQHSKNAKAYHRWLSKQNK